MKFIHLSDLHLGKRLNEFSLIEDQQHILLSIISIIDGEKPDAVFIAGDVSELKERIDAQIVVKKERSGGSSACIVGTNK